MTVTRKIEGTKDEFLAYLQEHYDYLRARADDEESTQTKRRECAAEARGLDYAMRAVADWTPT